MAFIFTAAAGRVNLRPLRRKAPGGPNSAGLRGARGPAMIYRPPAPGPGGNEGRGIIAMMSPGSEKRRPKCAARLHAIAERFRMHTFLG